MARYQIVFRNKNGGQQTMLVDDPTPERLSHLRRPLELGTKISTGGRAWTVVDESIHHGLRRFICNPVPHLSSAAPAERAGAVQETPPAPARFPLRLVASEASPLA
jgi:hypothetical protein